MHLLNRGGYWYYEKRVPTRYAKFDPRIKARRSLRTKYTSEAVEKVAKAEAEFFA